MEQTITLTVIVLLYLFFMGGIFKVLCRELAPPGSMGPFTYEILYILLAMALPIMLVAIVLDRIHGAIFRKEP